MIPSFEAIDRRSLTALTTEQIPGLDPERTIVAIVIASVEQHGPHLPLITDSLIGQTNLDRALRLIPDDLPVYTLPTLCYGKSNEHNSFPGTISLSAATLMAVLRDIGASLSRAGLKKLAFINGHGGNPQVLDIMARDLRAEFGLTVFPLNPGMRFGMPEGVRIDSERGMGIHGGNVETSMVLAIAPGLVRMDRAQPSIPTVLDGTRHLTLEGAVAFGWVSEDLAPGGVMGDPTGADPSKGELCLSSIASHLAAVFEEIVDFNLPARRQPIGV